jgi:hypothetical protein
MSGYYANYRGVVLDAVDPEGNGRVQVQVPDVTGDTGMWAVPEHTGAMAPAVGGYVVVRYQEGDENYPIWAPDGSASTGPEQAEHPDGHGTFRGVVVDNVDPGGLNRLAVQVPDVWPGQSVWAKPEHAVVPDVGTEVWIRFEGGDFDHPTWSN